MKSLELAFIRLAKTVIVIGQWMYTLPSESGFELETVIKGFHSAITHTMSKFSCMRIAQYMRGGNPLGKISMNLLHFDVATHERLFLRLNGTVPLKIRFSFCFSQILLV